MSFLGSAAGAVAGGIIGTIGSIWQNNQNSAASALDRDFQREVLQNRNQWQAEDLKNAGINPILTAGSPSSAIGSNASIDMQNPLAALAGGINSAMSMDLQERQLKKDLKVADSTIAKQYAEAYEADERSDWIDYQKEGAKIANDRAETDLELLKINLPKIIEKMDNDVQNSALQGLAYQADINMKNAQAYQANSAAELYNEQKRAQQLDNDFNEDLGTGKLGHKLLTSLFGNEAGDVIYRAGKGSGVDVDFGRVHNMGMTDDFTNYSKNLLTSRIGYDPF